MGNAVSERPPKKAKVQIGFRTGASIKEELEKIADEECLDPSDIYRRVFNAGLKKLYNFKVVRNELAE